MEYSTQIVQYIISGITLGSIYAIIGLSFTVIYNTTGVLNLAQGDFTVWGGFSLVAVCTYFGLPLPLGLILSMLGVFILGIIIERLVMFPLRKADLIILIVVTVGISTTLQGGTLLIFGKESKAFPAFSGEAPLKLFGAFISPQVIWILGTLCVATLILWYFFNRTIYGKAMQACSEDRIAAKAMGINPDRMSYLSWGIGGALGALAGALVIPITLMNFHNAGLFAIKGIAAIVLGGLGSYRGATLGGFLIGLLESMGAGFISPLNKDIFAMAALIGMLLIKPSGIFGNKGE
jgi:branched-chain amino acid transport system permease protein